MELLVTLAIVALLAGMALPSFEALLREHRASVTGNELLGALALTRSEAIRRDSRVTLCTSQDGQTCGKGIGWQHGWIIFHDPDQNALRDVSETILLVQPPVHGLSITGNTPVADYVSYVASGTTLKTNNALQMGTITLCAGASGHQIVVSATGRPRSVPHVC